ncbi:hypothetical protein EB061_05590 [bacterium]|nr:hypothetical protein [bacterium]
MVWLGWVDRFGEIRVTRSYASIQEASDARQMSGDILFVGNTHSGFAVVRSETWLWPWEREAKQDSYAWQQIYRENLFYRG